MPTIITTKKMMPPRFFMADSVQRSVGSSVHGIPNVIQILEGQCLEVDRRRRETQLPANLEKQGVPAVGNARFESEGLKDPDEVLHGSSSQGSSLKSSPAIMGMTRLSSTVRGTMRLFPPTRKGTTRFRRWSSRCPRFFGFRFCQGLILSPMMIPLFQQTLLIQPLSASSHSLASSCSSGLSMPPNCQRFFCMTSRSSLSFLAVSSMRAIASWNSISS